MPKSPWYGIGCRARPAAGRGRAAPALSARTSVEKVPFRLTERSCRITAAPLLLFHSERKTVGTLILCGIGFVSAYLYAVKAAVVVITAVMSAAAYSTFNTLVCAFRAHFHLSVRYLICGISALSLFAIMNVICTVFFSFISLYKQSYRFHSTFYRPSAVLAYLIGKPCL